MSFSSVPMRGATLVALHPDLQPAERSLSGEAYVIGRNSKCQIVVERPAVSRVHARIERRGAYFVLRDLGSFNGTFVNERLLNGDHQLQHQDTIGLANATPLLWFLDHDATLLEPRRLAFDQRTQCYIYQGVALRLPRSPMRLLDLLFSRAGEVCSREECVRAVWPNERFDPGRIPQLHKEISELRERFKAVGVTHQIIKTRHGVGYYLDLS